MSYYNTTQESGKELKTYREKAKTQDQRVLQLFNKGSKLSASLLHPAFNCPITSIRRSLNTLEKEGKIEKTGIKITGSYGRKENLYRLR